MLYGLVRKRKQPIEIQRLLGIRTARTRLPRSVAAICAGIIDCGIRDQASPHGCLLMEAKRAVSTAGRPDPRGDRPSNADI